MRVLDAWASGHCGSLSETFPRPRAKRPNAFFLELHLRSSRRRRQASPAFATRSPCPTARRRWWTAGCSRARRRRPTVPAPASWRSTFHSPARALIVTHVHIEHVGRIPKPPSAHREWRQLRQEHGGPAHSGFQEVHRGDSTMVTTEQGVPHRPTSPGPIALWQAIAFRGPSGA